MSLICNRSFMIHRGRHRWCRRPLCLPAPLTGRSSLRPRADAVPHRSSSCVHSALKIVRESVASGWWCTSGEDPAPSTAARDLGRGRTVVLVGAGEDLALGRP